jgi:hypothetical protein
MNIRSAFKPLFALSAFVAFGAHAAIINYSFTANSGHAGTFSYDDTAVTIGGDPYGAAGGVAYSALSFVVDGTSVASPELVIYQNYEGNQFVYVMAATGATLIELGNSGTTLFSSSAASQMDNRTLASFDGLGLGQNMLEPPTGPFFELTSLTSGPAITVPEPDVAMLLLAAAAGLAIVRRRQR